MSFIISKLSTDRANKRKLYYLVENHREGKKIKRKTLLSLGEYQDLESLLNATQSELHYLENRLHQFQNDLDNFKKYGRVPKLMSCKYPTLIRQRLEAGVNETISELTICKNKLEIIQQHTNT